MAIHADRLGKLNDINTVIRLFSAGFERLPLSRRLSLAAASYWLWGSGRGTPYIEAF
jgi:hypothetical protein